MKLTKKLTKKQAVELSIKKWEYIVSNKGHYNSDELDYAIPELKKVKFHCGLCEKYLINDDYYDCVKCPLFIEYENPNYDQLGCTQTEHPFNIWIDDESIENAQAVLDLIKSIKV